MNEHDFSTLKHGILLLCSLCFWCSYVWMAEPDHIIVRPIPNMATETMPAAFKFFYITPREMESEHCITLV